MKFLIDQSAERIAELTARYPFVGGQLLTPLTRYLPWEGGFAVDNGAYTSCDVQAFRRLVATLKPVHDRCLWIAVPDVVGSARRTLEVFDQLAFELHGWPIAFVCQDGQENLRMPWDQIAAIFIGGSTEWKMSQHATHLIKAARLLGKHTHVGRVNGPERFSHFDGLGVDTCDGTGASRDRERNPLEDIAASLSVRPLLEAACAGE